MDSYPFLFQSILLAEEVTHVVSSYSALFGNDELPNRRLRLPKGHVFMRVMDLCMDSNGDTHVVGMVPSTIGPIILDGSLGLSDELSQILEGVPAQRPNAIRVYIEQDCDTVDKYVEHVGQLRRNNGIPITKATYCKDFGGGYAAAASQWRDRTRFVWSTASSFIVPDWGAAGVARKALREAAIAKKKNRLKLLANLYAKMSFGIVRPNFDFKEPILQPRYTGIGGAQAFALDLLIHQRYGCVLENQEGNITMVISCQSHQGVTTSPLVARPAADNVRDRAVAEDVCGHLKRLTDILAESWGHYAPLIPLNQPVVLRKILVLWYHHANLLQWSEFVEKARSKYFAPRQRLLDSRDAFLQNGLLEEITGDAFLYKELGSRSGQLTILVESLLSALEASIGPGASSAMNADSATNDVHRSSFAEVAADIRGVCADLNDKTAQMQSTLEHHLRFLELRREMKQSKSLGILSMLAGIFLPLSLACGILSMQTRFVDLGYLLYDFCAVVVMLITLVLVIVVTIRIFLRVADELSQPLFKSLLGHLGKRYWSRIINFLALAAWGVVLSSFIVGLVYDIGLGGKILGFGLAACVASAYLLVGPLLSLFVDKLKKSLGQYRLTDEATLPP